MVIFYSSVFIVTKCSLLQNKISANLRIDKVFAAMWWFTFWFGVRCRGIHLHPLQYSRVIWMGLFIFFLWFQVKEMLIALLYESDMKLADDVIETILNKVTYAYYGILSALWKKIYYIVTMLYVVFF